MYTNVSLCVYVKFSASDEVTAVMGASHAKWDFKTTDFIIKVQGLGCMFTVYACVDCPYFLNKDCLNWEVLKLNWKI